LCLTGEFLLESAKFYRNGKGVMALVPVHYRTQPGTYLTRVEIFRQGRQGCQHRAGNYGAISEFPIPAAVCFSGAAGKRDDKAAGHRGMVGADQYRPALSAIPNHCGKVPLYSFGRTMGQRVLAEIRFINDVDSGRHSGIDIGAPSGTPVIASNHGIVVLAQNLYVTGNTVVVDHGLNLFRSYCHSPPDLCSRESGGF